MAAYNADNSMRKIVYIIVDFDDRLDEYRDDYSAQIDSFIVANPTPEIEIVFHTKPRFYSATVKENPPQLTIDCVYTAGPF